MVLGVLGNGNHNTCDGKPMTKAAEKLPRPKTSTGGGAIDEAKLNHEMLMHIVDKLLKYPQFVKTIHSVLYSEQFPIPQAAVTLDKAWELAKVRQVKLVPKAWMAGFLLKE